MTAEIIKFRPELYRFFADFPRDLENARALGELMAFGDRGVAVVKMGFAAKALAVCARTGVAVSRVARVSGLGNARVSAFYEGYKADAAEAARFRKRCEKAAQCQLAACGVDRHEHGGASLNAPLLFATAFINSLALPGISSAQPLDELVHVARRAKADDGGAQIEHRQFRRPAGLTTGRLAGMVEKIQHVDRNLGLRRVVLVYRAALDAGDDGDEIDAGAFGHRADLCGES